MALTDTAIRKAKARAKSYKLTDGAGLYLEVMPNGARYWRMRYRYAGKDTRLAFGVYPEVTLAEARHRRDKARAAIRDGRDPSADRKAERRRAKLSAAITFEGIAREWLASQRKKLTTATYDKATRMLEANVFPWLGTRPIADIDAPELLAVLKRIEARGAHETAHRVKARIGQVFRYAIAHGTATRDPSADLRGALAPVVSRSHAAVTDPAQVGDLLRALDSYSGQFATRCALRLAPLVFARPGELRHAEWSEFDLDAAEWRIPAHKMKMREAHVVPLSQQAVTILRELEPLTGRGRYLFPSLRSPQEPMSENTVNAALRRLGFDKDTMTGHGFRAMASTRLNEMGWAPDVIERQLAHAERNKVRAAYNRAQYMAERVKMMAAWADYLDNLRVGAKVIPIKRKST
ncbi:integrase arm-type DNA-binding domain-containing protein [Lysobacter sp. CFH 32150]|uniref:tyrosine-type recombinase/integrase n=1 Tax=Lysobacter sp. CFH 32150 TaxID=2927128 RepID=UPI001FA7B221|nr:integrase arm-type DNA-binding domain-containing protein [Lysobacter sp. CFH 32150]MCI4567561.1 tyrosine-type recombinase/integrase [Lysobacter sp. CFH 32150]